MAKFKQTHIENPVAIVRTKNGWLIKNEGGDKLSRPLKSHAHGVSWCLRNGCAPVANGAFWNGYPKSVWENSDV